MSTSLTVRIAARPKQLSVEALQARIADLSRERQDLRTLNAAEPELERNRLEIVEAQWDLSHALVRRYLPAA
jgi:chorismate-pyruvate lyase